MNTGCFLIYMGMLFLKPSADEWVEAKSPHFTVVTNGGPKAAQHVAQDFERIRLVFQSAFSNRPADPIEPVIVVAAKDEKTLRSLLPQYTGEKSTLPAGVFSANGGKYYIALRTDLPENVRYETVYHEYFHLMASGGARRLPVWLSEGLAEFWENVRIRKDIVEMGRPNPYYLKLLHQRPMMSIETLVSMERNPHENDPRRVSLFYAQSWLLAHYIMVGDGSGNGGQALETYLRLLGGEVDPLAAFTQVFGNPDELAKQLFNYSFRPTFNALRMEAPAQMADGDVALRSLSPDEAVAVRENFVHR